MIAIARARRAGPGCGGYVDGGDRADIDSTQPGRQNIAPKNASTGTGPAATAACAATKAATFAARSRIVPCSPGAMPNSVSAHRVQRRSEAHRVADAAPIAFAVLVRDRTCAAVARSHPHCASAHAIAHSEYRSPRSTPLGTTTRIALQALHRYRRATTSVRAAGSPGARGPSIARPRIPCPTITNARPGSRPAASHTAQNGGRTASHDGGPAAQDLTSISQCTIRLLLRVSVAKADPRSTAGNGAPTLSPPPFSCRHRAAAPPPCRPLRRHRPAREKPAYAMAFSDSSAATPSRTARDTCPGSLNHRAR